MRSYPPLPLPREGQWRAFAVLFIIQAAGYLIPAHSTHILVFSLALSFRRSRRMNAFAETNAS
jgi:hypothetical protein